MADAFIVKYPNQLRIITPFNREFVDALKDAVPYVQRRFHADSKTWTVDLEYEDKVRDLVSEFWTSETLYPTAQPAATPPAQCSVRECLGRVRARWPHHTALGVWPEAPPFLVLAAYRALAQAHHPDHRGGDGHAAMVAINRAYEALKHGGHDRTI